MIQEPVSTDKSTLPRSLKERQRAEREELILQAAEAVLAEKGYHDTSIEEIAARVGIAKGTVYLHFPGKEDLVVALVERELLSFLNKVEQAIEPALSARERLERVLRIVYSTDHGQRTHLFLSLSGSSDIRARLFAKQEALRDRMSRFSALISSVIGDGKATGEISPDLPTEVLAATFISLLSPKAFEQVLHNKHVSHEDLVRAVARIFFSGVSPEHSTNHTEAGIQ